ncbi:MAG: ABC transporter permease [Geminicoccaceae bacterium]
MAADATDRRRAVRDGSLPSKWSRAPNILRPLAPVLVLLGLVAALGVFEPSFLSFYSLTVLAGESSVILLLATAQTVVILLGCIDLSMAALASLASVLIAFALPFAGLPGLLAVLGLTTGLGALQGFIHARAQVPSFVVTLAGMGLCSGAALAISPATIPVAAGYEIVGWLRGKLLGLPTAFVFAASLLVLLAALLRWMPLGRHVYAIGMGETAALLSGIRVARTKVLAFALTGLFAGLAGMLLVARTRGGHPSVADSLLLPSIAAVVVGGTAITGGLGGMWRTLAGVLIIAVLRVGIAVAGLDPGYEPLAYGAVIVAAVVLTIDRSRTTIVK